MLKMMRRALEILQHEQDAASRASAEHTLLSTTLEELCAYIFRSEESLSTRLIACSVLATQSLSKDMVKQIIQQMCFLDIKPTEGPLLLKLANIVAINLTKIIDLLIPEFGYLISDLSIHFDVYAPILEEIILGSLALNCRLNIKLIAMLSTSVFAAASTLPINQLTTKQSLQLITLLKAASSALPNDPSLFSFLFMDNNFTPYFFNLCTHPEVTSEVTDLITTLLTIKLSKNNPTAPSYLGPPLLYFITNGPHFYSNFSYNQIKAIAVCFTTIFITHSNILRSNKEFIISALNSFFCVFAQHPSHFIFDVLLPSLINIFNDLSVRNYNVPTSLTMYLIERICFYINRYNLRTLLSVSDGDTLTESEKYLSQDSVDSNTSFWLTWFAAFKGNCMSLVGKLTIFYPSFILRTLAQTLSQFFTTLAAFEDSMTLEDARRFTRHTEQYNTMDSVIAIVDAAVYSVVRHLLFNNTYAEFLQPEEVQQIGRIILMYKPVHPILYYRLMSVLENFYKDSLSSICSATGDVVIKPLRGRRSCVSPKNQEAARKESSVSIKAVTEKFIAPLLQPIFQLYLQMIVFKSRILQEMDVSGEELYSKLSQDTLAIRRLAADRAKNLASNRYLLKTYIIPNTDVFSAFVAHVSMLQQDGQITAYECVLLNQVIASTMLAHNDSAGFKKIIGEALEHSSNVLFSQEVTAALVSEEAFINHFGLNGIYSSNQASLTTPTPLPSLLNRRKIMFSIQQAKEVLIRMHECSDKDANLTDLLIRMQDFVSMLLRISTKGFLAATPRYFEQQLSNQRVLLGGTISGGVAKVDLEHYDTAATDIEHAHSWLERCLVSSLQCMALDQSNLLFFLTQLDYSVIPAYILRLILSVVPRACNIQVIMILSRIVDAQYYDVHAIYTMLTHEEHTLLETLLPRTHSSCVLARTAQSMLWESLQEKKDVLARNLLYLCNKAVMDICIKLFLIDGDINEHLQVMLSTSQQFVDYSLSLLFSLLVSFSSDAKCAAHIATLISKIFDFLSSLPTFTLKKAAPVDVIRSDGVDSANAGEFTAPLIPPISPVTSQALRVTISQDIIHRITIFAFALTLQYSQYDSYLSCFCMLAGKSIQLAEDQPPIGLFYLGNESLVYDTITELKNTSLSNSKHVRHVILISLKQIKRIQTNVQVPTNITIAALISQRAEVNDSMEVNIGDYTLGDTLSSE